MKREHSLPPGPRPRQVAGGTIGAGASWSEVQGKRTRSETIRRLVELGLRVKK
jgi:hypothetical protein